LAPFCYTFCPTIANLKNESFEGREKKKENEENQEKLKVKSPEYFFCLGTLGALAWQLTGQTKTRTLALWNFAFVCRLLN
jgi:hypothetical protein